MTPEDKQQRQRAYERKWKLEHPERDKHNRRKRNLLKRYNLSLADYDMMMDAQSGSCAVCHVTGSAVNKGLHVDHEHSNGKVRGLLCGDCNRGIGFLKDSVAIMENAIGYINRYKSN